MPKPLGAKTTTLDKIALTEVRVFDGERLGEPVTVVIDGARIGAGQSAMRKWDGEGRVLLPGLIDCHVHLGDNETLAALACHGVTTALDMGTDSPEPAASLRGRNGMPDVRSSGASVASSFHAQAEWMGRAEGVIANPDEARAYVSRRAAEGVDYIRITVDLPGFDEDTLRAIVKAAHAHGLLTIAHAATLECVLFAQAAGVDVLTRTLLGQPPSNSTGQRTRTGEIAVPTLTAMEAMAERAGAGAPVSYDAARAAVGDWYRAGVPILAGSGANQSATAPASPPYGSSLHRELELLVNAGLSTLDALRSATVLPARHFGLGDRGSIAPGKRADLVLIDGDPLHDICAVSEIAAVWCAGVPVAGTLSRTEEARSRSCASA